MRSRIFGDSLKDYRNGQTDFQSQEAVKVGPNPHSRFVEPTSHLLTHVPWHGSLARGGVTLRSCNDLRKFKNINIRALWSWGAKMRTQFGPAPILCTPNRCRSSSVIRGYALEIMTKCICLE